MEKLENSKCCNSATNEMPLIKEPSVKNGIFSFVSTLLIILIPKCPLCIAAYSGVVLMFFDIQNEALIPFFKHAKPILACIVLLLIALNYNPSKSKVALSIGGIALSFLLISTYLGSSIIPNALIYAGFLFAVWYNGNFNSFYTSLFNKVNFQLK